ncbi:hypothetical protein EJP02_004 [Escherichia phage EJP2]|nr:hypothetical protein EJP02_004 [Escherichia phage EJP2]
MKVQINATSWVLRRDSELVQDTPTTRRFFDDHGVVYEQNKDQLEYHESMAVVDIPCETVQDIQQYCKKYNAKIEIQNETALISFF